MPSSFLRDLVLVFGLCVVVVLVFHRLRVPPIIGFLLTGVIVGPGGLGLVRAVHDVDRLAEVGVVVLLFTIGVEFSLQELSRIGRLVFLGGAAQVLLTVAVSAVAGTLCGVPVGQSIFLGCLVALSSTAVVLKILSDGGETGSPHGRLALGINLFQDLCTVPMLLLVPVLGGGSVGAAAILGRLATGIGVVVGIVLAARYLMPRFLHAVVKTRSRELFVMSLIFLFLGTALLTAEVGLSLALGAFLAGIVVSESEYGHQALGEILPFKDALASLFFVSVGMLCDVGYLLAAPLLVLGTLLGMVGAKAAIVGLVTWALRFPRRTTVQTALILAQVGEFSFVLVQVGKPGGLLPDPLAQLFPSIAVLSMALTPLLVWAGRSLAAAPAGHMAEAGGDDSMQDHVVVVGFGLNGRNLVRALTRAGIEFRVVDMNPGVIPYAQRKGLPFQWGDSTRPRILLDAGIRHARVLVVAISDAAATRRTVELARRLHPGLHVIARTRYLTEVEPLLQLGASEVVPEELETSIEIFSRTLAQYFIPREDVESQVHAIRDDCYGMFRVPDPPRIRGMVRTLLPGLSVETFRVAPGSRIAGQTLAASRIRPETGLTLLAVRRDKEVLTQLLPDLALTPGDVVVAMGSREALTRGASWFLPLGK